MQSKCTCKSVDRHRPNQKEKEPKQHEEQATKVENNHAIITPTITSVTNDNKPQQQTHNYEREADSEPIELCNVCRYHRFLPQLHLMPDMLFNNNLLRLEHFSGVGIEFNPLDALKAIEETKDPLRVAVADGWQSARADFTFARSIVKPFDWTFTTNYRGTLLSAIKKSTKHKPASGPDGNRSQSNISQNNTKDLNCNDTSLPISTAATTTTTRTTAATTTATITKTTSSSSPLPSTEEAATTVQTRESITRSKTTLPTGQDCEGDRLYLSIEETDERIDVNKLKVREEILFYDDITLYEDELADHGTAQYNVKVRVMPSSLFILARFYLRIDGVLARINDTRIYHDLSKRYILREYTNREAKLGNLSLPVSTVINPSELMNHLPLIESKYEKLILPRLR